MSSVVIWQRGRVSVQWNKEARPSVHVVERVDAQGIAYERVTFHANAQAAKTAARRRLRELSAASHEALTIARRWACELGCGFHPDTRGDQYEPPLSASTIYDYDADMQRLFAIADDPYAIALEAMQLEGYGA